MDTIKTTQDLLKSNGSARPVMVSLTPNEARLIAAAPELLEACKLAVAAMGDMNAAAIVRAAIALAEKGRQP